MKTVKLIIKCKVRETKDDFIITLPMLKDNDKVKLEFIKKGELKS